jgi:sterol desaturase/sphingolipid hydroxylase (fatty acid hydroxylase superfamily)
MSIEIEPNRPAGLIKSGLLARPIANRRVWHLIYGGAFAAILAVGVLAVGMNPHSLWQEIIKSVRNLRVLKDLLILFGSYAVFSILECVLPAAGPRKPLQGYWLNFKITSLEYLAIPILGGLTGVGVIALGNRLGLGWIDLRFSTGHGLIDLVLGFLLSMFIYDFFFYWFHRFQHESFLWQQHKLHHMDEQLCAFTRESWFEVLLEDLFIGIPQAILFKLNPAQGAIFGVMATGWNTLIHTNIKVHLGPLGVLFNGPQGHRIHHSRMREHYDRNFAAFFPIWDLLFGTYHHPKKDEYPLTGVQGEKEVQTLLEAAALPIREWHNMFHAWRKRRDAVRLDGRVVSASTVEEHNE